MILSVDTANRPGKRYWSTSWRGDRRHGSTITEPCVSAYFSRNTTVEPIDTSDHDEACVRSPRMLRRDWLRPEVDLGLPLPERGLIPPVALVGIVDRGRVTHQYSSTLDAGRADQSVRRIYV